MDNSPERHLILNHRHEWYAYLQVNLTKTLSVRHIRLTNESQTPIVPDSVFPSNPGPHDVNRKSAPKPW